jgi:hypothetical protein
MTPLRALVLVTGVVLTTTAFVTAQTPPEGQSAAPAYRPGLGDLMTTTVQPRHIKHSLRAFPLGLLPAYSKSEKSSRSQRRQCPRSGVDHEAVPT